MTAVSPEAIARKAISSRPSVLRTRPPGRRRRFGERALRVIALLEAGSSRLEAARDVGLDKANVRVIELRARRRGMLAGVETRVDIVGVNELRRARVADTLRRHPEWTLAAVAAVTRAAVPTVVAVRRLIGLPPNPPGRIPGTVPTGPADPARAASIRMARAAGRTLQSIGDEYGITRERVRQILARYAP